MNEQQQQHLIASAGDGVSFANSRATANTFFPNWENVHPIHDRLIKKTEVSEN